MAMLTFWGLEEYKAVPSAVQARHALVEQMNGMMLKQWEDHGFICGTQRSFTECESMIPRFYVLAAFSVVIDQAPPPCTCT